MMQSFTELSVIFIFKNIGQKGKQCVSVTLSSHEPLLMFTEFFFPFSEKPKDNSHYMILYSKYFHNPT